MMKNATGWLAGERESEFTVTAQMCDIYGKQKLHWGSPGHWKSSFIISLCFHYISHVHPPHNHTQYTFYCMWMCLICCCCCCYIQHIYSRLIFVNLSTCYLKRIVFPLNHRTHGHTHTPADTCEPAAWQYNKIKCVTERPSAPLKVMHHNRDSYKHCPLTVLWWERQEVLVGGGKQ